MLVAVKSEFRLYGEVGGMAELELLAYAMRSVCGRIAAEEMRGERNGECNYIRNV